MSSERPEIILYGYEMAPNVQKALAFLSFYNVPFNFVEIPVIMPRPQLSQIGITYRRTPLLSINSDMYIDTSLIISKLADIAQHSPKNGLTDATNHLEFDHLGQLGFECATVLTPPDAPFLQDKAFLADRAEMMGRPFDPAMLPLIRPMMLSKMLCLLHLVETHYLSSSSGGSGAEVAPKKFVLPGPTPSTADMYLYWSLNWGLRYHKGTRPDISASTHPRIFQWLEDVERFLKGRKHQTEIAIDDAYAVLKVPPKHEYARFVPHVENNPEGLNPGQRVKVTPTDNGKTGPQFGSLLSLNYEQVCLRNDKELVMHFPRMGYTVEGAGEEEKKKKKL